MFDFLTTRYYFNTSMSASKRTSDSTPALMGALGIALLAGMAAAPVFAQPTPDELRQRTQELDNIRAEQRRASETEANLQAELDAIGEDRRKLNQALIAAAARARDAEERVATAEERIKVLSANEGSLRHSLAARQSAIIEVLAALQRMGHRPPPAMLVHPDDALRSVRSAMLLGAVIPDMRVEAESLAADLADLARLRGEVASERSALARSFASLAQEREKITALSEERRKKQVETERALEAERLKVLALSRQAGDLKDLIGKAEQEIQGLQGSNGTNRGPSPGDRSTEERTKEPERANLAALRDPGRLSPAIAFASAQGRLPFPVNGARVKEYGAPDRLGGTEKGITISARIGAQVTAPCDGWVVYAAPFRNYGQVLILNAGGGYHVVLAGMERIAVDVGQFVLTGEPVAIMGVAPGTNSQTPAVAGADKSALYVEFRKDGVPIDPAPWWAVSKGEKVRG
jgi:murein hydrolase activator